MYVRCNTQLSSRPNDKAEAIHNSVAPTMKNYQCFARVKQNQFFWICNQWKKATLVVALKSLFLASPLMVDKFFQPTNNWDKVLSHQYRVLVNCLKLKKTKTL